MSAIPMLQEEVGIGTAVSDARQARDRFKEELGTVRSEASRHADIAQENAALKRRLEHQTVRAVMPSLPRVTQPLVRLTIPAGGVCAAACGRR